MPIPAGTYDVECKTAAGSEFTLVNNIAVTARESKRIVTDNEIAGFVVSDPKVARLEVERIYALRAGTNEIAAGASILATRSWFTPVNPMISRLNRPVGSRESKLT